MNDGCSWSKCRMLRKYDRILTRVIKRLSILYYYREQCRIKSFYQFFVKCDVVTTVKLWIGNNKVQIQFIWAKENLSLVSIWLSRSLFRTQSFKDGAFCKIVYGFCLKYEYFAADTSVLKRGHVKVSVLCDIITVSASNYGSKDLELEKNYFNLLLFST